MLVSRFCLKLDLKNFLLEASVEDRKVLLPVLLLTVFLSTTKGGRSKGSIGEESRAVLYSAANVVDVIFLLLRRDGELGREEDLLIQLLVTFFLVSSLLLLSCTDLAKAFLLCTSS